MTTPTTRPSLFRRVMNTVTNALNGEESDYTEIGINRAIVLLSIPMILEMLMESLFAVVDAFFVSKISTGAVATIGLTESMLTLIYSVAIGVSSAATAMVARRTGEGNREAAAVAGAQTILIGLAISLVIAIPGFFFAHNLLQLMTKDAELANSGYGYTRIMLTCNLPILLLWMLNGIFRGAGDAATAMRALWIANGVNLLLDPMLIFGFGPIPAMGIMGAATATTIGRSIGVVYQLYMLTKGLQVRQEGILLEEGTREAKIRLKARHFKPNWPIIRRLLQLSSGSTGQYLIASASWIFMIWILGHIGTAVTAGYTIAIRMIIFTIMPSWGMANAAATLVGQNLGAGKPDRAEASAWRTGRINMYFMGIVGVIYLAFAPFFIRLFSQTPEVIESGAMALRILAGGYVFYGYGMILTQALNGAGDTKTPSILNFIFFWLVETPLAWWLALHCGWGQGGVYWSIVIAESMLAVAAIWVFSKGKWKELTV